jgi:hypothetical protein
MGININDLDLSGASLFADNENFLGDLRELSSEELKLTGGGGNSGHSGHSRGSGGKGHSGGGSGGKGHSGGGSGGKGSYSCGCGYHC